MAAAWRGKVEQDWDRAIELLEAKINDYLAVGITGVGDALVTPQAAELYRRADAAGRLPMTVQQLHGGDYFFARQDLRRSDLVERILRSDTEMLRGGAVKIFADRAFPDGPAIDELHDGCTRHVGTNFYSRSEVVELAVHAAELGIAPVIHAMGSCAVDNVLDAYEEVRRSVGDHAILRLEHAFVTDVGQASRIADLSVDLVVNPGLSYQLGELFTAWRSEGQHQLRVLPVRSMIDAGVRVSVASDHPCGPYTPMQILWSAVTRKTAQGNVIDADERISVDEGLRAATAHAAAASGRFEEEGSLEVVKRANLIVLDRALVDSDEDTFREVRVTTTVVDGKVVYGGFPLSSAPGPQGQTSSPAP